MLASVLGVPVSERKPRGRKTLGASSSRGEALGLLLGQEAFLGSYQTQSSVQSEAGCQAKAKAKFCPAAPPTAAKGRAAKEGEVAGANRREGEQHRLGPFLLKERKL